MNLLYSFSHLCDNINSRSNWHMSRFVYYCFFQLFNSNANLFWSLNNGPGYGCRIDFLLYLFPNMSIFLWELLLKLIGLVLCTKKSRFVNFRKVPLNQRKKIGKAKNVLFDFCWCLSKFAKITNVSWNQRKKIAISKNILFDL